MNTRAKFTVGDIIKRDYGTEAFLHPVYDGSDENKAFFAATPSGNIHLIIKNEVAADSFEVGKSYYVDFIPA